MLIGLRPYFQVNFVKNNLKKTMQYYKIIIII